MPDTTPPKLEAQRPPGLPAEASPAAPPPRRRRRWPWVLLALLLAGGVAGWWFWPQLRPLLPGAAPEATPAGAPGGAARARPGGPGGRFGGGPVPVSATAARRQDIPVQLEGLGTVQALNTITIRSQVDGVLVEVLFTEGQDVRRGDVLARIDPRTYQAALSQALAKKAQDEALLANSRLDLARYTELARSNGASRQQLDTQRAQVAQYEALVQADEAQVMTARTQLDFTTIRSPVDGRVGIRLVDQGNLVRGGDASGLVVVTQVQPISVTFTLPQQELPRITAAIGRGPVPVQALAADREIRAEGMLLTIDNQVDTSTGTIKLKATFPNEDRALWPGAFVNVRMRIGVLAGVNTIPLVAVQRGPDGAYAFVVKDDNTVEQRPLQLGLLTATDAVVRQGLAPGERVVTSGALRLNPGAQVTVVEPVVPPAAAEQRRQPRGRGGPGGGPPAAQPGGGPAAAPGSPNAPPNAPPNATPGASPGGGPGAGLGGSQGVPPNAASAGSLGNGPSGGPRRAFGGASPDGGGATPAAPPAGPPTTTGATPRP